jgi:hypothetical protein
MLITSVSINSQNSGASYQLQIGTRLDHTCRKCLMPLLEKKSLEIEEEKEFIRIYKVKKA